MSSGWNLREVLRRASGKTDQPTPWANTTSAAIESGDFRIDLARRSVTLRDDELELTSEEFDVLVFLARHPQSVITPHTMLTTSWAAHRVRQTEFLRVLNSLRAKLDSAAGPNKHYLRTEPWVIYRFDSGVLATT
jgi:two-component system KDP operon response regulator KdpE